MARKQKQKWIIDKYDSPCIDAGDPSCDYTGEPVPNGCRINMGAFGGTAQASKSGELITNIADINKDGRVDLLDFGIMCENWLWQAPWADGTPEE